jgi:hypothetical protein
VASSLPVARLADVRASDDGHREADPAGEDLHRVTARTTRWAMVAIGVLAVVVAVAGPATSSG